MTPTRNADASVGARLAVVEASVAGLQTSTNKLEAEFVRLESTVSGGFAALSKEIAARDKTPWGLLISGVLALLAIMSLIGGLAYAPVKTQLDALAIGHAKLESDKLSRREVELLIRYRDLQATHFEERLKRLEASAYNWRPAP